MHRTFGDNLRHTPIRYKIIEFRNLLGNIRRKVLTVLIVDRPHNNHQLIRRLRINEKFPTGAIVHIAPNLVLNNLHVRRAEVRLVERSGLHIPANGILRLRTRRRRAETEKAGKCTHTVGHGRWAIDETYTPVVHHDVVLYRGVTILRFLVSLGQKNRCAR